MAIASPRPCASRNSRNTNGNTGVDDGLDHVPDQRQRLLGDLAHGEERGFTDAVALARAVAIISAAGSLSFWPARLRCPAPG